MRVRETILLTSSVWVYVYFYVALTVAHSRLRELQGSAFLAHYATLTASLNSGTLAKTDRRKKGALRTDARWRPSGGAPVIRSFFVIEVADTRNERSVTLPFRPINCLALRFERAENVICVVFDDVVVDGCTLGAAFRPRFNVKRSPSGLSPQRNCDVSSVGR
jgi:hypothetical protein